MNTLFYFIGLIIFSVSFGGYTNTPPFGFMIFGGGCMLYALVMSVISFLHNK
jgi:hypothetical protein